MNLAKPTFKVFIVCLLCPFILTAQTGHGCSRLGRLIASQSALVSKILTDSVFLLAPGVKETELAYLDAQGRPMHIFILQANLARKNIRLRLLTPANRPAIGMQPITKMIKAADSPD